MDGGWKAVEVEPEAVGANGNGNGHHDAIGPAVELVVGGNVNGHATSANGADGHEDVPEPQQSLFSWAEFMAEEPVKFKGRGRKPPPASASLFGWAVSLEQKMATELVGAGR